ncbi:hypothetical protein [Pannonibacter sp. SL95]|uniref:hypothetical protein n=1 Tax=Pannonibacter sp. SL95 TaxID=2995153 RepID=UPI002276EB7C|nr:hypothetical protein [Pannonibacter sp. SL95]MCY1708349.1 hypothetical protein [Pannonibacter sp. SL95]
MTFNEARNRCSVNGCSLQKTTYGEYKVTPRDGGMTNKEREAASYYTDDLEDAALTSGRIRSDLKRSQPIYA